MSDRVAEAAETIRRRRAWAAADRSLAAYAGDLVQGITHSLAEHGDPCDCPPAFQRRQRGRRRMARLRRLWVVPRLWSRFIRWFEWQVGR